MGPISLAVMAPLMGIWGVRFPWFALVVGYTVGTLIRRFTREVYYMEDLPRPGVVAPMVLKGGDATEADLALEE